MITKEKIAQEVITASKGGQITSYRKLDPREVYEVIEKARNALMQGVLDSGGVLDGEFITQFKNVPILNDMSTHQKYSIVPTRLVSFSDRESIQQVSSMKNQRDPFVRIHNLGMFGRLEAGAISGRVGYYPERVKIGTDQSIRIYYENCPFQYKDVMIKMIASTYDFDEDEALPIPAGFEQQLVAMVYQELGIQLSTPLDLKNDVQPPTQ